MMRPFAVDANAIALFQMERVTRVPGHGTAAIDSIVHSNCIALDNEKLCLQEWLNAAKGAYPFALEDWLVDMIAVGKIKYYSLSTNSCRKQLLQYGLPQDDHKWVRLALGSDGKALVTADVDFFEPTQKKAKASVKEKIIASGRGSCSKALLKNYGVEVVHVTTVPEFLAN